MCDRLIFAVITILLAVACNKPLPDYSHQAFDFNVTGINDMSIAANDHGSFTGMVNLLSGNAEKESVSLSFKDIPANVFLQNNNYSFKLNYSLADSFGARNAMPGKYPMQAVFASSTGVTKTYDFNLTITDPINRPEEIAGYYYPSNDCGNLIYVTCEIVPVTGSKDSLMIIDRTGTTHNSNGKLDTAYAITDCCANSFTIGEQTIDRGKVEGHGYLTAPGSNTVILTRTFTTDTLQYSCTVTLSH